MTIESLILMVILFLFTHTLFFESVSFLGTSLLFKDGIFYVSIIAFP